MAEKPDAFLSYTRFDDRRGQISEFRTWLGDAVEEVSGHAFEIFQDIEGIGLGQKWKDKLDEMLDQARFFIPILTPKFFNSRLCRDELSKFLELERKTGRQDLVLPIYWITCPVLEEGHLKAKDELAQAIDERQRWDWRDLRFKGFEAEEVQRNLAGLASQIERARRNVLRVIETPKAAVAEPRTKRSRPALKTVETPPKLAEEPPPRPRKPFEIFRDIDAPWCPEMVMIPAGAFLMGSPDNEEGRWNDEGPQHEVTISRAFALGRYPVTFDQYDHFCDQTHHKKPKDDGWGRGRRPVINVSWEDAQEYCTWLSEVTNTAYRLPTEAEWEYACRAGTPTAYAFGDQITKEQANFGHLWQEGETSEVGAYRANPWMLHDMHGNVWEWCADGKRTYDKAFVTDPKGPAGAGRALRGESWNHVAQYARSAYHRASVPGIRSYYVGFRCARVQEPAPER